MNIKLHKDEWYPWYFPVDNENDYYDNVIELTLEEFEYVKAALEIAGQVQAFLQAKVNEIKK